jgi:hypothetical protein
MSTYQKTEGLVRFLSTFPRMRTLLVILFFYIPYTLSSQDTNFWHTLAQVSFKNKKDPGGYDVEVPVFSNYLKTFDGKRVRLKGYVIPLDEVGESGKFMLSSLPFNICYFCGAAGPETVVEIVTREKVKFTTKQIVMEGTILLNESDPNHHIYILKEARLVN